MRFDDLPQTQWKNLVTEKTRQPHLFNLSTFLFVLPIHSAARGPWFWFQGTAIVPGFGSLFLGSEDWKKIGNEDNRFELEQLNAVDSNWNNTPIRKKRIFGRIFCRCGTTSELFSRNSAYLHDTLKTNQDPVVSFWLPVGKPRLGHGRAMIQTRTGPAPLGV